MSDNRVRDVYFRLKSQVCSWTFVLKLVMLGPTPHPGPVFSEGSLGAQRVPGIPQSKLGGPIWVFPKMVGFPPQIIHFNRVFHDFHHPFWGPTPIFGNTRLTGSYDWSLATLVLMNSLQSNREMFVKLWVLVMVFSSEWIDVFQLPSGSFQGKWHMSKGHSRMNDHITYITYITCTEACRYYPLGIQPWYDSKNGRSIRNALESFRMWGLEKLQTWKSWMRCKLTMNGSIRWAVGRVLFSVPKEWKAV